METYKFTETVFTGNNKKGILTPDSDGYYTVIVGGLNTYNSAGEYYTAKGALELFNSSSHFMRRIKSGALYAELGHPKKQPGMTMEAFYSRVISIEETNICGHFSDITLDFSFGKKNPQLNNPELIAIIAKVKPAGAKANALQLALENPKQNSAFSVRGLTENKYNNGRTERILTNIITFDHVTEPGISIADKAMSPVLEQRLAKESLVEELTDVHLNKEMFKKVLKNSMSHVTMESEKEIMSDLLRTIDRKQRVSRIRDW